MSRCPLSVLLLTSLVLLLPTGSASAEALLMSGHYDSQYGALNIPLLNNMQGTGFVNVTGSGSKRTVTIPPGVFAGAGMLTVPIPGDATLQQLFTSFSATAPAAGQGSRVLAVGLSPLRPNADFAWCPGMTVSVCTDFRSTGSGAAPGQGTQHGLVRYTAGGLFSGTMRQFFQGTASVSRKLGLTPRFQHDPVGGTGTQAFGGAYATANLNYLPPGVVTTGAVLGGSTASGGVIASPGVFITNATAPVSSQQFGFPLTTGSVYARHSVGAASATIKTGVGSHDTLKGRGNITLVATGLSNDLLGAPTGFPHLTIVSLDIASSQRTPALSPLGLLAVGAGLAALGVLAMRARGSSRR